MNMRKLVGASCAAALAAFTASAATMMQLVNGPSDIRVAPLVEASWAQGNVGGSPCYNSKTPENCLCGCVATASGQIMCKWQYPTAAARKVTNTLSVNGVSGSYTMLGGPGVSYDWANMPLNPAEEASLTTAQRNAVGTLLYDIGVAAKMDYNTGSSATFTAIMYDQFTETFGYSNAAIVGNPSGTGLTLEQFTQAILPSLDAGMPVLVGIGGANTSHSVICDGYGYQDGDLYIHINMGQNNNSTDPATSFNNTWYKFPTAVMNYTTKEYISGNGVSLWPSGEQSYLNPVVYNISPTMQKGASIVSGRVLSNGSVVQGATVVAFSTSGETVATATSNAKGIYALTLPAGIYTLRATTSEKGARRLATVSATSGARDGATAKNVTIGNQHGVDFDLTETASAVIAAGLLVETPDEILDFVESNGSQYIDTGVRGRHSTKADMDFMMLNTSESWFLGSRQSSSSNTRIFFCYLYNNYIRIGYGSAYSRTSWQYAKDTRYSLQAEFTPEGVVKATRNGSAANDKTSDEIIDSGYSLYLFACNVGGTATGRASARCYATKIWQIPDGGTDYVLVRDFVPCRKNGVAGLYDRVSKTIFYSKTSTALISDNSTVIAKPGKPDSFVDYVESSGGQYIDTEIIGKSGTKVAASFTGYGGKSYNGLFGENTGHQFLIDHWNNNGLRFMYDGYGYAAELTTGDNVYNDISVELSSDGATLTYVANGVMKSAATGKTAQDSGTPMYIFGYNLNGGNAQASSVKLYAFRIWQDGALVRNYRPCVTTVDGTARAGLYDTVSDCTYFSRSGTDLNAPPETEPLYLKYVQSSGAGYFNTGLPMQSGTKLTFDIADVGKSWGSLFGLFKDDVPKSYTMIQSPNVANCLRGFCNGTGAGANFNLLGDGSRNSIECEIDTSGAMYVTLNGSSLGSPYHAGSGAFSFPQMMYLLAASWQHGGNYNILPVTLYGCTISQTTAYDSGSDYTLMRDFVPASKYELVGLVDTVDGVFYPCVGTLTPGPAKGVSLVDSVKSDGALYVDTGITPKSGTSLVIDYADWTGAENNAECAIAGAINGAHQLIVRANDGLTVFGGPNNASGSISSFPFSGRHTLAADWTKGGTTYISADGGASQTPLSDKGEYTLNDRTIWLFAANNGSAYRPSVATLYGARIWQDGALVRDFRPCVTADGTAALYDMVSASVFYAQDGDLALPADTTERPATAVWKGGAVSSAANLANAANWTCTSLSGDTIANAVPGGATTIHISSASDPLLSIPSGVTVPAWAGVRIAGNLALTADADWTKLGTVTFGAGTAINLAGHGLTLSAFAVESGNVSFNNSGAAMAALTLTGTAGTSFTSASFGDKVKVVKNGAGDAAKSAQLAIGGATGAELDIADGALYLLGSADLVAGWNNTGTIKVSGGKVNTSGLTVAFTAGSVGVLEQSGGEIADTGDMTVGWYSGVGTVRQTGGKMTVGGTLRLSRANANEHTTGTLTQSAGEIEVGGKICIGMVYLGDVGVGGKMTVSGGVELGNNGGTGTLCVTNGGRLVTSSFVKGSGTANILFDGGTVQATAAKANFFNIGAGPVTLGAGGLTLETEYDLGFNATTFATSGGTITKVGAGALDLSGLTVEVGAGAPRTFDFATAVAAEGGSTIGVFTGLPTVASPWKARLTDDGKRCKIYKKGVMLMVY